jgi:CubicO group peptidase (beta-lactamase class C family)
MKTRSIVLIVLICVLIGCNPVAAEDQILPTNQSKETAAATEPSTATIRPTPTPIPAITPYDKIPEQTSDGWKTTSLVEVGINPVRINKMLSFIYRGDNSDDTLYTPDGNPKYQNIHSVLIVKDGKLVFEEYFYGYQQDAYHNLASVTKSITSLLVGLAIEQGYIKGVQEVVLPYFPEFLPLDQPDDLKSGITIEDLLTMRHGLECDDWDPSSVTYHVNNFELNQPNAIEATLNLPMEAVPGSQYSYCSASTVVLGGVLTKALGMSLAKFANFNLFFTLGVQRAVWTYVPGGWVDTGGGMQMLPRDMARLGLMMLQNGSWGGEQIIPEEWVEQSIQAHVPLEINSTWGNGYGYLWWLSDVQIFGATVHSFAASGAGGQVIAIFPRLDMVVVITGGNYQNDEGQPFQIMEEFILPAALGY